MLKHIKSFEDYNVNIDETEVNEALFGLIKTLDEYSKKIGEITTETPDEDVKKIFSDLFQKQGTKTSMATPPWKRIKVFLESNKISRNIMIDMLNKAKSDYEQTKDMGYLVLTNSNQIGYKKSSVISNTNAWGGTGSNA